MMRWLRRWYYVARTFRNYGADLNRRVDVENTLLAVASGKRGPLTPAECWALAMKLGVPS